MTVISLSDCRSVNTSVLRDREEINKSNVTGGTSLTTTQTPSARPCCVRGSLREVGTVAREIVGVLSSLRTRPAISESSESSPGAEAVPGQTYQGFTPGNQYVIQSF